MNDLDKARIWAGEIGRLEGLRPGPRAAVEVIQSLPDQWIDADRVREVLDMWAGNPFPTSDEVAVLNDFEALLVPSLPTLEDMTPEERQACLRAQAKTWYEVGILVWVDEDTEIAQLITRVNGVLERKFKDVTPLPDLPKLEWPGSHADTITAESVEDVQAGRVADFEPALPRPEDVPAGEPWIVEHYGHEWVGARDDSGTTNYPWALAKIDGTDYVLSQDVEVTLVSRLVPEVKP